MTGDVLPDWRSRRCTKHSHLVKLYAPNFELILNHGLSFYSGRILTH